MTAPPPLPLRSQTSPAWARLVLREPLALLRDHAHLEHKAAANALGLLHRWPRGWSGVSGEGHGEQVRVWTRVLTRVARDEVEHLGLVLRLLANRGATLDPVRKNPYAAALRGLVRGGQSTHDLIDRLLISAVIEARSCERFERLAAHAEDEELRRVYRGLLSSERGHFGIFRDLAFRLPNAAEEDVGGRWEQILDSEAEIIARQGLGPRMHSKDPGAGPAV